MTEPPPEPATKAVSVRVTGRVQGVSFRWYAAQEAERAGVRGWVRNEPDGSVAGHFEGSADAVDALVAWCHRGPSAASVSEPSSGNPRYPRWSPPARSSTKPTIW